MIKQQTTFLLIIVSVLFLVLGGKNVTSLPDSLHRMRNAKTSFSDTTISRKLALINQAVAEQVDTSFFSYTGGFENPFKKWNEKPAVKSGGKTQAPPRTLLSLKGILMNRRPLAILDNGEGETQIRGVGEQAFDQSVVSISKNHVTLRDHLGTYEIAVEEK